MLMQTHELIGKPLDWAVLVAQGESPILVPFSNSPGVSIFRDDHHRRIGLPSNPSLDWRLSGPLLFDAGIALRKHSNGTCYAMLSSDLGDTASPSWAESTYKGGERYGPLSYEVRSRRQRFDGTDYLVAGLRCFVASRIGPEVDIPEELF